MAITESRVLPPQFIEDLAKILVNNLTAQTAVPIDTSRFAPQVAAQDPLQTQAATLAQLVLVLLNLLYMQHKQGATDFGTGIASAQALTGTGAGTTGNKLFKILCLHFNNKLLMQH